MSGHPFNLRKFLTEGPPRPQFPRFVKGRIFCPMQSLIQTNGATSGNDRSDRDLVDRLQKSAIYREYQKAFEAATGLPLALKAAGSFQAPLHESKRANGFCLLMAAQNKTCAACLELQQRIEAQAQEKPATLECFAGLSDSAVPVRLGDRVVAYLQTGQVLRRRPSQSRFNGILRRLKLMGIELEASCLRKAYFETQVVPSPKLASILTLLGIFAEHLSSVSNQLMVSEGSTESHSISRARAFIAEHIGEQLSLTQVARVASMSVYYFCKIFKKEKGVTFTEYLGRLRVEAVKQMLLDPHKRISEAAYDAGFQSLSQFNRVFRHFAGETPSNYREILHRRGARPGSPERTACVA
jgi:AraC-like DNA-binding protein